MSESLIVTASDKEQKYLELFPQLAALVNGESDQIANFANICAALKQTFNHLWIGFYLVKDGMLVLGPFQGPIACTRIPFGRGVCGSSWRDKKILIVPDVEAFPGHIACSSLSRSEIVIPMLDHAGECFAVLDVDSENLDEFDHIDEKYLQQIVNLVCI